jgi:hypothetical protein
VLAEREKGMKQRDWKEERKSEYEEEAAERERNIKKLKKKEKKENEGCLCPKPVLSTITAVELTF